MKLLTDIKSAVTCLLLASALGSTLHAQLLNVQFSPGTATMVGAAAIGTSGDIWNNYNSLLVGTYQPAPAPSGLLLDSSGATTSVSYTLTSLAGGFNGPYQSLLQSYISLGAGTSLPSVTTVTASLSGLTSGGLYDLYLYSSAGQFGGSIFTETFTVNGTVFAGPSTPAINPPGFVADGNYIVVNNVLAAGGLINITLTNTGSAATNAVWNGFQLQAQTIPEPSVIALFAVSAAIYLVIRKRHSLKSC
jgi:hypothetical protein